MIDVDPSKVQKLSDEDLRKLMASVVKFQTDDIKNNQLLYYKPVSDEILKFHECGAHTVGIFGGNGSGKSESALVDLIISATGVVPHSLKGKIHKSKLRGPVSCRVVCRSLSNMLHTTILPKIQWWRWDGESQPGGERGHWGWIPRNSLIDGAWDSSWSEKNRILRVLYRDPENHEYVSGESTIQFMSSDQDALDMAASSLHVVMVDELTSLDVWRENKARVMRGNGRITLSMTWPDDAGIPCDWVHDEVVEPGSPGPNKDKNVDIFEIHTTDNRHLDQNRVAEDMGKMDEKVKSVRIMGRSLRFSNRIHPLFTDTASIWCFKCGEETHDKGGVCGKCSAEDITQYCHVVDFENNSSWPTLFLLDPHPRKPHMISWVSVDPYDDLWQVAELQVDKHPSEVRIEVDNIEKMFGIRVARRLMDPNMGASSPGVDRGVKWRDEFMLAGIACELANDSDVGRSRVNEYLKPDARTLKPRIHIHPRCKNTIFQMKRFCWSEHRQSLEKDLKERPKDKYDDYPALWRYCLNTNPSFSILKTGAQVLHRSGRQRGY